MSIAEVPHIDPGTDELTAQFSSDSLFSFNNPHVLFNRLPGGATCVQAIPGQYEQAIAFEEARTQQESANRLARIEAQRRVAAQKLGRDGLDNVVELPLGRRRTDAGSLFALPGGSF